MKRTTLLIIVFAMATIFVVPNPARAMRDPGVGGMPMYNYARGHPIPTPVGMPQYNYVHTVPMPPLMANPVPSMVPTGLYADFGRPYIGANVYHPASTPITHNSLGQYADGSNLYQYVRGNPLRWQDPSGLQIMICTRPTGFGIGRHAYLWDTTANKGNGQSCGESGSSGSGSGGDYDRNGYPNGNEPGPGTPQHPSGHACAAVPNSDGKENCVMNWCKKNMNNGPWIPFIYDCHSRVEQALKACGLSDKGVSHPRL